MTCVLHCPRGWPACLVSCMIDSRASQLLPLASPAHLSAAPPAKQISYLRAPDCSRSPEIRAFHPSGGAEGGVRQCGGGILRAGPAGAGPGQQLPGGPGRRPSDRHGSRGPCACHAGAFGRATAGVSQRLHHVEAPSCVCCTCMFKACPHCVHSERVQDATIYGVHVQHIQACGNEVCWD